MVMHICARFNTLWIWPPWTTAQLCKRTKAADVCGTVGNAKESYNKLCQVKALVPVAHTFACFNTRRIWPHLAITCVCKVTKAAGMCGTVKNVCDWHQCLTWWSSL